MTGAGLVDGAVGVTVAAAVAWWSAPRLMTMFDRRVARRRLGGAEQPAITGVSGGDSSRSPSPEPSAVISPTPGSRAEFPSSSRAATSIADTLRAIARALRSGATSAEAVMVATAHGVPDSPGWLAFVGAVTRGVPVERALEDSLTSDASRDPLARGGVDLVRCSVVEGALSAPALERAADVLDEADVRRDELRVAVSHARQTARILTGLPVVVAAVAFVVSPGVRESSDNPAVVLAIGVGAVLNVAGRVAVRRATSRVVDDAAEAPDGPARIADALTVMLGAGLAPAEACRRLGSIPAIGDAARSVSRAVGDGRPLREALEPFAASPDTAPIADVLLAAARDGVATAAAAARLADDARRVRQVRVREVTASLPARLAVPVTTLVLPSFLIGAIAPLVVAGLGSVGGTPVSVAADPAGAVRVDSTPTTCPPSGECRAD